MKTEQVGERFFIDSPIEVPCAAGFLWNRQMMIQMTCRGYAVAQFMQPEPAKYAYAPNLEARTFMQPEQPYYAHHPGRFFYIKDEDSGSLFSAPYEPVREPFDRFEFSIGKSDLRWSIEKLGIAVELCLTLAVDAPVERWSLKLCNASGRDRLLSLYPYFPIGYMSWMNQSATYRSDVCGIVASCVTPYQKVHDYFKNRNFKDKTYLLADQAPTAWETRQGVFEGEGGLNCPTGIQQPELSKGDANYETPAAVLQYRIELKIDQCNEYRFAFGPAADDAEVESVSQRYLKPEAFIAATEAYKNYIGQGTSCLWIDTPDEGLNQFVNHWLARQMFYHGDVNRLTTDPQTRNYLQDGMGMSYLQPALARKAFMTALSQQEPSGAMPEGILLVDGAELKYINQVPHTDHCVWLPVCLKAYLDETNDYGILQEPVTDQTGVTETVFDRITRAVQWLVKSRDERGLSYIAQGDWCDPMNMVGYKGKGVSGWLSVATAYALNLWADICHLQKADALASQCTQDAQAINQAVNTLLWDGGWFARGITDDGAIFGTRRDSEGRIFLNTQAWSILSGAASKEQQKMMIASVAAQLETPYGVMTLAPAFTKMREDIGRVTQKFPGSAENGSVYSHDAMFYVFSLYHTEESDRAYRLLRQLIPGPDQADYIQRGQLPVFIPNYYRGAYYQHPEMAGRSSRLFNTGTISWLYRCLIEGLFGINGDRHGLRIQPQLPSHWDHAKVVRHFRGATFEIEMRRSGTSAQPQVRVNGLLLTHSHFSSIIPGTTYQVEVQLPA